MPSTILLPSSDYRYNTCREQSAWPCAGQHFLLHMQQNYYCTTIFFPRLLFTRTITHKRDFFPTKPHLVFLHFIPAMWITSAQEKGPPSSMLPLNFDDFIFSRKLIAFSRPAFFEVLSSALHLSYSEIDYIPYKMWAICSRQSPRHTKLDYLPLQSMIPLPTVKFQKSFHIISVPTA